MKRDMDLIRTILLKVEADETLSGSFQAVNAATFGITDHTDTEVIYHLVMLVEAGFLVGNIKLVNVGQIVISKLTWNGHEFLDDIRDPEIWRKTKERAKSVPSVGLGFLWESQRLKSRRSWVCHEELARHEVRRHDVEWIVIREDADDCFYDEDMGVQHPLRATTIPR